MYCEDSGRGYLYPEEVSRGFLRPSLEETLASNRSRSVGGEEEEGVVGSCRIRFLSCFSFPVFPLLSFPFVIARSLLYFVGIRVPLSP